MRARISPPATGSASSASARASTSICRADANILVGLDSRCVAGETVIAEVGVKEVRRLFRKS